MLDFLKGYKTYIVGAVVAIIGAIEALSGAGIIAWTIPAWVLTILAGAGLITLRSGIKNG